MGDLTNGSVRSARANDGAPALREGVCGCGAALPQFRLASDPRRWVPERCRVCDDAGKLGAVPTMRPAPRLATPDVSTESEDALVRRLQVPPGFDHATLNALPIAGDPARKRFRELVADWVRSYPATPSGWRGSSLARLLMWAGPHGSGKTWTVWAVAKALARTRRRLTLVRQWSEVNTWAQGRGALPSTAHEGLTACEAADVLVLEDVAGPLADRLVDLLCRREEDWRPTILTTSLGSLDDIGQALGARLTVRLAGGSGDVWAVGRTPITASRGAGGQPE